jgi:hydrogenase maturation protease
MAYPRILVAGVGNIFFGDDAFGVEVARQSSQRTLPEGVQVSDFGIRGFDLAYAILDDYDAVVLVDATARGGEPGALYIIEPDLAALDAQGEVEIETHGLTPDHVLRLVKMFGGEPRRLLVLGCEPGTFGAEGEGQMGLSEPVALAVCEAVQRVESLVNRLREEIAVSG